VKYYKLINKNYIILFVDICQ